MGYSSRALGFVGRLCAGDDLCVCVVYQTSLIVNRRLLDVQICSMFALLELPWGNFADQWFAVVSALNVNLELTSPECAAGSSDAWLLKFWLTMTLPAIAAVAVALVLLVAMCLRRAACAMLPKTDAELRSSALRTYYQLLVVLYLPLTAVALSYFGCERDVENKW